MKKKITTLEDLLADEEFLTAYDGRNGTQRDQWREWLDWTEADPARAALMKEAIQFLSILRLAEAPDPLRQPEDTRELMQRLRPRQHSTTP